MYAETAAAGTSCPPKTLFQNIHRYRTAPQRCPSDVNDREVRSLERTKHHEMKRRTCPGPVEP